VNRRHRRVAASLVLLLVTCGLTAGCGKKKTAEDEVRAALHRTAAQPRLFSYVDHTSDGEMSVTGTIEDDFRYRALLALDQTPAYEERAVDDALAARVSDARVIGVLGRATQPRQAVAGAAGSGAAAVSVVKGANDPRARTALTTGQWVLDRLGAPSLLPGGQDKARLVGEDPVLDSLSVLKYVETAARQAHVILFYVDDINYKPREDPFPHPDEKAHEIRYDFLRQDLPHVKQDGKSERFVPTEAHFRKMSVYVRDGLVVRVLEDIDVASRVKQLARIFGAKIPAGLSSTEITKLAVQQINAGRAQIGEDPIRVRTMSVAFADIGTPQHVVLPGGATVASLALLRNRGSGTGDLPPATPSPVAPLRAGTVPAPVVAPQPQAAGTG
jgi:hypothetical protein